jgi:capsular polysaccharide biosynthesis protein
LWTIAASLLAAVVVTVASLLQTPTYEASAVLLVAQEQGNGQDTNLGGGTEAGDGTGRTQTMIIALDTRPVAEEVIRRLGLEMSPYELLDNLTVEQGENTTLISLSYVDNSAVERVENTKFISLISYEDADPEEAARIAGTFAEVASERISEASATANDITATWWKKAEVPEAPASPKPWRNGLIALVVGLALCAGTALARTDGGTRVAGTLGERPSRLAKLVGQAGVLGRRHRDYSIVKRVKEKKLLRALGHRGKLTAVEAALETSLSVEEANRMLFDLAAGGHLEVTVEDGKLLYSFWEHDAP